MHYNRHVLAAAILGHANVIVTQNVKHFPEEILAPVGVLCSNADTFLLHQFHLAPYEVLTKLDEQGANLGKDRLQILESLTKMVPKFAKLAYEASQ